ncbi:MAG: c-type cytochrome [Magnetococcales bacterium]|nr:c-type cytochrome [Magnetococcales bacterium]
MKSPLLALSSALLFATAALPAWSGEGSARAFAPLYQKYCAVCHGTDGKARSMQGMTPPPTDFTLPEALVRFTREGMIEAVRKGKPNTAMTSWEGVLKPEEMEGVVDYIQQSLMLSSRDKDAGKGRKLFAENCSVCHGDKGNTAVWAQSGLNPAPRNFTTDKARQELNRERMIFSVTYGRPETAMPAWNNRLSKEEIEAVVDYVRGAFVFPGGEPTPADPNKPAAPTAKGAPAAPVVHEHYNLADMAKPLPFGLKADAGWGKEFYNKNCAVCHGELGDGKGPRSDFIYPKPRNFLHTAAQHKFNRAHLFEVIATGMRGTEMPAWNKVLSNQEIANVAEYVFQTFIKPGVREDLIKLGLDPDAPTGTPLAAPPPASPVVAGAAQPATAPAAVAPAPAVAPAGGIAR